MEPVILKDIVIIFALSVFVNLLFTKIKVPTIVGYLLTGIISGPFLLGLIGSPHEIELMAEIGVVLLMFSIGMEFSLKHLLKIRNIVFLGGFIQVTVTAAAFFVTTLFYGMTLKEGLFVAFLAALSSSALVLKILQSRSELTSNYGRTVLGILIFQDLLLVPLILFAHIIGNEGVNIPHQLLILFLKTLVIIGFVYAGNKWFFPRLLHIIALAKNQELFMMSIFLICLSIALLTFKLGMSLAFGAFLAGLMVSESEYSHNAFGSLIPFKDTFSSFFFVSVGMLLDLNFVIQHLSLVLLTVMLVLVVKTIVAGGTGFILGHTFRGTVLVGLALCQVGEFSFVLSKIGLDLKIITTFHYQLFLAVAVISISLTPFLMQAAMPLSGLLMKLPLPKFLVNGLFPLDEIEIPELKNHLVIIGKDSSALKLSAMAKYANLSYISIAFDPMAVRERQKKGETVIYGDAINEPILLKAQVQTADIVVISIGDMIASMAVLEKVRIINPHVYILSRAKSIHDIEQLYKIGADQVFPEKFEIAIDLFSSILTKRLVPRRDINTLVAQIRSDYYGIFREKNDKTKSSLIEEMPNVEISAVKIDAESSAIGKSLSEIRLRTATGATLLALRRAENKVEYPDAKMIFRKGDIAYIMGDPEQINKAMDLFIKEQE